MTCPKASKPSSRSGLLGRQAQDQNSCSLEAPDAELNKIHDQYGSDVLEEQLLQAEANRWQSITLKNYEEFGVSRAHRPGQSPELSSSTPPIRCSPPLSIGQAGNSASTT